MEKAILTNYGTGKVFSTPIVLSNEKYSLGRGLQNDCVFDDVSISRNHCTIEKSGKEWIVIDRSSNGTLVNGNLLGRLKAHVLQNNDVVTMGNNIQFQFVKQNSTPEPVSESNKSSLSEKEIMNIADAIIAEVEGPKLSQSLENEFNIPMDIEGNSSNDISHTNEDNSSVKTSISDNVESSPKSQPSHSIKNTINMTPILNVPKTTVISLNPGSCYITKGSLVINSNANPKTFTLSSLSQPIFVQNTLSGAAAATSTASTAIPSWLIGVVSHKINQQSQKSKSSITKTTSKSVKLKSSVSSPPKTYSNTKKGTKKKSTTETTNSQSTCLKSVPQVKEEPNKAEEIIKEKISKEETEPKPGCSKSSETKLHGVEDELQCSICTEMFIKAVTLSCSHTFCKFCIDEWKRKKTACPICRAPIRSILPTLVIDNFIEKILENADEETKLQRSKLIADRESQQPSGSKDYRNKEISWMDGHDEPISHDAIILSSDSDTNSYDSDLDMSLYDEDSDEGYVPYNGLPGVYYGGYGFCYRCGEKGHWVRGCPNV